MNPQPSLGRLSIVKPREVWPDEARDFTPWLLRNSDVLSELLGMDLALERAEHPVGGFFLDIIGRDEATNQVVIVENQLAESDHRHLGQILTYAAGTRPTTIVWIATSFRSEHRAAIDWLNERTDEETRFFAVEIEVVRIGDSDPAPAFKLIAQPNDWGKQARTAAQTGGVSEKSQLYWQFWSQFSERVRATHPTWTRGTSTKGSYFAMSAGTTFVNWVSAFRNDGLAVQLEFIHPDPEMNAARLDALFMQKDTIETAFGGPLQWEHMEGLKATHLRIRTDVADVADQERWDEWITWLISAGQRLRSAVDAAGGVVLPPQG